MWYIIHMKRFLKDIAQGIYDGLQENEATHNQYSFQEIYDVIQEFVSYFFVGLIYIIRCGTPSCMGIYLVLFFKFKGF